MLFTFITLVFAAVIVNAQTPTRPKLSSTFESRVSIQVDSHGIPGIPKNAIGDGVIVQDEQLKRAYSKITFSNSTLSSWTLSQYDLGYVYTLKGPNANPPCTRDKTSGTVDNIFSWVPTAKYVGTKQFKHRTLDLWNGTLSGAQVELGVFQQHNNQPVMLTLSLFNGNLQQSIEFFKYETQNLNRTLLEVPSWCKL